MESEAITRALEHHRAARRHWLLESEACALLAEAGLSVPRHLVVSSDAEVDPDAVAGLGSSEVVVKVLSPDILHKSDVGGVRIVTASAAGAAIKAMDSEVRRRAPEASIEGWFIAEKIDFPGDAPGAELLLSLRRDPAFGPVITCGPGGVLAEWYGELSGGAAHLMFSADGFDAARALDAIEATPFGRVALKPSRRFSVAPIPREDLGRSLEALASFGTDSPQIDEIELNPVVGSEGRLIALDALVRLAGDRPRLRRDRPVEKVRSLLRPRSAAIWGASTSSMNPGRIILRSMKSAPGLEKDRVYAVHPRAEEIDGVPCFRSTADLPEVIDLAVISIPAAQAATAVEEICAQGKAQSIILIPGGFAETGDRHLAEAIEESLARSREREDRGPVLVGGNCLGIVSKHQYNTFFLPTYKLPFSDAPGDELALISQSGAYIVTFTSNLDGILFPKASISYGNEMDLTAADLLEYFLEHEPSVRVFAIYMEGIQPGEGERFLRLVRRARREGRYVVVYKAGLTAVGAKAAASHTASIAGDYALVSALLREAGAVVCKTLNMFEDMGKIFTMLHDRPPRGRRVGVISNAGFECGAISDHLHGLELAEFRPETRRALEAVLPSIAHCGNPIDCTPMTSTAGYVEATRILSAAEEVDALIVSAVPATPTLDVLAPDHSGTHSENVFGEHSLPMQIARLYREIDKLLVVTIDSGPLYDPGVLLLERAGVPVYRKIDRAGRALSAFILGRVADS